MLKEVYLSINFEDTKIHSETALQIHSPAAVGEYANPEQQPFHWCPKLPISLTSVRCEQDHASTGGSPP